MSVFGGQKTQYKKCKCKVTTDENLSSRFRWVENFVSLLLYNDDADRSCSAVLCSQADSLCFCQVSLNEWLLLFIAHFEYPLKWCWYSAVSLLHYVMNLNTVTLCAHSFTDNFCSKETVLLYTWPSTYCVVFFYTVKRQISVTFKDNIL